MSPILYLVRAGLLLPLGAALSSCDGQSAPAEAPPPPIPAELCLQAKSGLDKLGDGAGLVFTDAGEMTIERQAWLALPGHGREQVARILAIHASCVAGGKSPTTEVTIRDESGVVLLRQVVRTTFDVKDKMGSDEG